ncbi:Ig-like domain-containing protein [Enterobacter cloacae]|uniref:Ig-like domain-containing protein n=1 Tax=Enterobacter cloacae TaxID=550 RepID=UPI003F1C0B5F
MTDNKVILAVNNGDGKTRLLTADAGRTVKVKLIPGNKYLLKNINDDFAPENITLQRVDKALHIIQEGDTQPSIIIEDYFNGDPNNPVLMGMAEDGLLYAYVPLSGESYDTGYLMADGSMSPVALGGEPLGAGGPLLTAPDDDNDMLFGMLGWFALAAAGVGAAFALSEMDKDDGDNHSTPDKPSIGTTMDDEGSIKGPLKSGDTTDDSTPTLTGKGKPGDTIHIYDNDKEIGSVIVDDEGEWSYTPDKPLGEGEHELTVVEKDPDGNASPPSDPIVIVVDTVAPKAPTIEHIMDKVGKTTGEIHDDAYTDDPQPEMSGTGEAGATIAIYDNGKKIGETTVNDDGRWYFKPSENLTDGSHSITVSQTDKAGNVSEPSDERDFIVLTEPPGKAETPEVIDNTGPVTGPLKPGDVTDDSQPSFSGEGTPGNTIIIKDNDKEIGSVIVDDEGKWSFTPKDELAEGEHNVVVVEEDPLGNEGDPSDPIQIIVDTTPPAKPDMADALDNTGPITGQLKGGDVTDETRPVFSGKGEPGDTVTIYDGDEVLGTTVIDDKGNWTLKPEKPLGEGDHSITVTQTDKAGNTSDPSEALEFEVDTTAPDASANVLNITAVADDVGDRQGNVASGDITDDSKPLISGIGEAGNTVFVYTTDSSGKHLIGTAVVGSDGTWSLTPETPLTEGLNKLTLETQDPAGNRVAGEAPSYDINLLIPVSTAPSINSVVDNAEPHVGPMQKGESTNDTTPTLSGSAAPGDVVSILDNGKVIGTVTADSNGKWAFTPDTALADGKHTFTVTATDAAGNARTSGSFPIVIDTAAPSPAENIVINDNVGDKQGPVGPGDTTDDQSPTLSGEAEPGSVVDIYDNDEKIGSVIVDDEGKWSYTPDTPLAKGDHEITTTVTDPSGNTSEPSPGISFTVDPDPNQVTVGEVVDDEGPIVGNLKPGTVTDDARPELSGKGKPGSTVTIMDGDDVLGSTVVDPDGNWTFTPEQDLADGDHSLTVISKDPAGNEVTSPSFDITVDATAPEKPVLGSATDDVGTIRGDLSNGGTTDDANPTFNGSAEPGSRVDIYDNGEHIGSTIADDNGAWQFTPTTPLPEGEHHITTTATDEAGNTGPESDDFVLVTDYTPPVASSDVLNITSVMDDVGGRQGNVASGEITDDSKPVINGIGEAGSTVFVYSTDANGKHLLGSAVVNSEGTWTLALDTPLVEGLNQLTLETQDAVGNRVAGEAPSYDITVLIPVSTEPSINSVVDNAEPHVGPMQKGETTNDTTPTLSGSAAPGDVVSILDNGKVIGTVKADSSGKWSFTPDTALADGQHTFTVTATDAAGNARTSGSFPIVIDTAAPSPAENIVINDNVGDKQGPVGPGDTTDDQSPTLSGEAEPGSVVDIYDNDEKIGSVIVDDEGKWSYTPDTPLAKGDHEITTTVTDPSGNTSEPSPGISFTVDPDPNQVTVGEVVDDQGPIVGNLKPGTVTDDARPELSGKGKPGSTVTIMDGDDVLGSTVVDPDGNWTFTPEQDLADGDHSLTVISKDPAGNDVTSPSFDISVDTVAPEKPVIGVATDDVGSSRGDLSSGSTTDDANPTFKGSAEPGSRVDIYDNGELIGSTMVDENGGWQFTPTTALPEGEHHITTTATDKAGNTGPESDDFVLITDYTAPDASKVSITDVVDDFGSVTGSIASGGKTDDNTPLIKGTGAEPGNTITVYNGDKVIGTAKVQADGTWELQVTKALPDGTYNLTVKETDSVGNTTAASPEYIIQIDAGGQPLPPTLSSVEDDVAPHTGPLQKDATTNDNTLLLTGTAEAGVTVRIYGGPNGTTLLGETKADAQGKWSFNTPKLADGVHTFVAEAINDIGQVSPQTGGFPITVDTSAPGEVTGFIVSDNEGPKTGTLSNGDTTDDATPTISGKAEPGSVVHIYVNGQENGTAIADANGNWTYTTGSLVDGEYTFTARAEDSAGNLGAENAGVTVTLDTSSVPVTIVRVMDDKGSVTGELKANDVTDDARPEIIGKAKAGSTVTIMDGNVVLGSVKADASGNWVFTPTSDLGDGVHNITAIAKDLTGNEDTSSTFSFEIDSKAPNRPSIDYAEDQVGTIKDDLNSNDVTDDPQPILHGTAEAGSTVNIYTVDGTLLGSVTANSNGAWNFKPGSKLPEGKNTFYVTATDEAGNVSDKSADFILTTDYTAPDASKVTIDSVTDNVGNVQGIVADGGVLDDSRPVIRGSGAETGNVITVYTTDKDGNTKVLGTTKVDQNGKWELTPSESLYGDSINKLTVTETDSVGNVAKPADSYDVIMSDTPNAPAIVNVLDDTGTTVINLADNALTKDDTPTLKGTADGVAGDTITIYNGSQVVGKTTLNSDGTWSFTPSPALADGNYIFTVTNTNSAGQESDRSGSFTLTIDSTAPNPVSGLQVADDQGAWKGQLTDGMTTDDNKPTFTGKAEQGSTVTIYDNGQAIGSVVVTNTDGSWQYTPTTPLADGEHQFATQVTDPAGNASAIVDDITVNVSTGASYLQLLQVVDDVQETGGSRVLREGEVTNDSQVQLVGKATAGSTIIITDVGGVQLGTVKADANGDWEFTPLSSLSDGAHTLRITGTDPSNNPLTPIDFDLVVDTVAPVAPVITNVLDDVNPVQGSVAHGKPTNDTTPEITGTAEKGSTVNVYHQVDATTRILLGTAVADSTTGLWTLQITDANKLTEGTWNLVATSTDAAGNISTPSNTWTIVVDTTVSDAVINISSISEDRGASDTDFITSDNTLLINGQLTKALQADEWVEISLDNGATWTRASTVTSTSWTVDMQNTPLNDGAYTIQARVVDNAGNVGSTDSQALQVATGGSDMNGLSTTTKVTTDTSHGLTTGDHFSHAATATNSDMVTRDRTVIISGNLSAALQAGEHLQISLDNGKTWQTLALNGQSWSYVLPEATASTTHSFKLQVIDVAGNPGTNTKFADSYNVVIDLDSPNGITGAPDVPQHTTTGDSFTFSSGQYGRVEAGAIVSLVSDVNNNGTYQEGLDQVIGFVKANADGSWSLNTSLPSGAHNLAFVVWDEAGNRSSMSASTSTGVTEGGGSTLIEQTWGGTTDADSRGLNAAAVTISQDGLWSFFQSARGTSGTSTANAGRVYDSVTREDYDSTYLAQPSTDNGAGYNVDSTSYSRYVNSAAFADINRDGYADVMSQISSYSNAGRTAYWLQNADGSYSAKALDQGTLNHLGGVISYDREGDGYLDFVLGDSEADSISFIKNTQGTLSYEDNSGFSDGHPGGALPTSLSVLHEVGAVDIDNNGTVDITAHIDYNGAGNLVGNNSRGLGILYNQTTGTSNTNFGEVGYYANVFRDDGHEDYGNLSISMTYADYNNDGWLDLFLSRGSKGGSNSDESRIYLNDGTGKLNATDSQAQWFGDNVDGGTSLAVDWNHDGKMDIIEVPRSGVTGSPMLYTNTGSNNWGANKVSLTGSTTFNNMTGAVALDYDWDGSMDLVLYRSGADADVVARDDAGRTMLVKNTNIAADGTSLQIRIVDGNGINTFYSNTVKLYNSAGELVATQLINPQSSGSSNSMGLVSFFGLDPNEVYSVQMLRITDGKADHVGATSSIGGYTNGTVNESWGGLTTGKAHDSYVLTAESSNAANNTSGNNGIIGTGYNDTFFGSAGNDTYNGGGGWNQIVSGNPVWSETAGMDVVDYSRSTTAINANLWTGTATGNGTDKLLNIEGLVGSSQQDTFTDNSANNVFEGRGGNDAFYLVNGGNDTLMYKVLAGLSNDSTGGNGHDTIHGFKVGNLVKDSDADLLDMSELLDYKGSISFFEDEGKLELDYSSRGVLDYVKVEVVGSDTVISIDRDGQGGQHGFTQVVTLADVQTDLVTLLQNNQIMM